ncbi:MAG: hypothetical protein ANABAC_2160 [Anaerolineae bacterium]|jgi:hypothetical protein|nr:MAG: hypothetical protein ANABAC_2160 [Anaerolineae bacterium]
MTVYQLSHPEAWALATLLHLPLQPGSALADWLASAPTPQVDEFLSETTLKDLAAKGYYRGPKSATPFDESLIRALTLVSVNAALITVLLRTNGRVALVRFAQAGESYVQLGMDESGLALHPVMPVHHLQQTLLPGWFTVGHTEDVQDTLPLEAFLLFTHACNLADWAFVRSDFYQRSFSVQELIENLRRSAAWWEVFKAAEVKGVPAVAELPLESTLNLLIERDYLTRIADDLLTIGNTAKPLAATLTAPESCTLTLSLQIWEEDEVLCGAFLHGGERLFLLEFVPSQVNIQQFGNPESAHSWIEKLLERGRQARYAEYAVPPAAPQ